jgi:hypothetical protein
MADTKTSRTTRKTPATTKELNMYLVTAAGVAAILMAPMPIDDPTPSPSPVCEIPGPSGPILPGAQRLPPVWADFPQACGFHYDPGTGTWQPRVTP